MTAEPIDDHATTPPTSALIVHRKLQKDKEARRRRHRWRRIRQRAIWTIVICLALLLVAAHDVRAAGSSIAYNVGRFATAVGVVFAGVLFAAVGGSYPRVGSLCGLIYALGLIVIWWAPDTSKKKLEE